MHLIIHDESGLRKNDVRTEPQVYSCGECDSHAIGVSSAHM